MSYAQNYKRKTSRKKRLKNNEDNLQASQVNWFRMQYPGKIIYHVPNNMFTTIAMAVKMKKIGREPGIPDIVIPYGMCGYNHLYIENKDPEKDTGTIKSIKNLFSEKQISIANELRAAGNVVVPCLDFDDFKMFVTAYMAGNKTLVDLYIKKIKEYFQDSYGNM